MQEENHTDGGELSDTQNAEEDDKTTETETETEEEDEEEEESLEPVEMSKSKSKALLEFRFRVEEAINGHYLFAKSPQRNSSAEQNNNPQDANLWGVPLSPSAGHPGTDTVLLKFLRAKRYKVHEAFTLLRRALRWRAEFWASEGVINKDVFLRPEVDRLWFATGKDKEGRLICYNLWGRESQKHILDVVANDQRKSKQLLGWRVACVEKGINRLSFRPGDVNSIIQVIDLENSAGLAKKEVKMIYGSLISLLHNNYPGLVHKNLIINVPSWFMTLNAINLRLLTQKSRNRFIFAKPSKVTETLLRYANPENILVRYGGLRRENDIEFSTDEKVLEVYIRGNMTEQIHIPMKEVGVTAIWDVTVVGFEVLYKEEFIPDDDCSYKILLQEKRMTESIRNSFHIRESGQIVMTFVNASFNKKRVFYRFKTRPTVPMYMFLKKAFSDPIIRF